MRKNKKKALAASAQMVYLCCPASQGSGKD
jgi:hypothetical protein